MATDQEYGRRLIPNIIDERARNDPHRPVYSIPLSATDISLGFKDVSALDFANAVNRVSWWLEAELGKSPSPRTVGYIGPHDLRYVLIVLGCIKANLKPLLLSPRNSVEAGLTVLDAASCDIWIAPKEQPKLLPQLLTRRDMKVLTIPELDELLQPDLVLPYPYQKTYDQASEEVFLITHTSGSTGHPKPIIWKNSLLATLDATRTLPPDNGRSPWTVVLEEKERFCSVFPFFHTAGTVMNVLVASFYGTCNVLLPAGKPASLDLIDSMLDHANVKIWHIIPSIIDEIGETPTIHNKFRSAKVMIASGGPVTYTSANKVTDSVKVINITGTSEGLFQGSLLPEPEDWNYFAFHPYAHFEFREVDKGLFEHHVHRSEEHVALYQGLFQTFPDVKELNMKDLYVPHPTKKDLWLYKGRTDDMIVLSSGEKIHPADTEATVNTHPAVSACLVAGTARFQPMLLVELTSPQQMSQQDLDALLASIYVLVEQANEAAAPYARIFKDHILIASADKPFARTDKGTVKRRGTIILYEPEIEELYKRLEVAGSSELEIDVDLSSLDSATESIRSLVNGVLPTEEPVGLEDDFFGFGIDSIHVIRILRGLRTVARKHNLTEAERLKLTTRLIYSNSTIKQLAGAFYNLVNRVKNKSGSGSLKEQEDQMKEIRMKYETAMPRISEPRRDQSPDGDHVVILTGSTGSIGSYLLESLLKVKRVKKVVCFNRSANAAERQAEISKSKGLPIDWPADRVEFWHVDLSQPQFGLGGLRYEELLQQVTHIMHLQWPVNFNLAVTSFEPFICGVRRLIDFSLASDRAPSLFFASTITAVWRFAVDGYIKEVPAPALSACVSGYASSKLVSEAILQRAYERSGVDVTICRSGQAAGPVHRGDLGMWSKNEWVPAMIASSKYLRALPSSLGSCDRIDWIPVDILADIFVELADVAEERGPNHNSRDKQAASNAVPIYHSVNPDDTTWAALLPVVVRYLDDSSIQTVPYDVWVDMLVASQYDNQGDPLLADLPSNPALRILGFFQSLQLPKRMTNGSASSMESTVPMVETERSETKSGTLASLGPVGERWMKTWLSQWKF